MVYVGTKLKVFDNSGAKVVRCLKNVSNTKRSAKLGNKVIVNVISMKTRVTRVKKRIIYYGLIIGLNKKSRRLDGTYIRYDYNKVLLLDRSLIFLGTRVYGHICKEVRSKSLSLRYKKIISYARLTF